MFVINLQPLILIYCEHIAPRLRYITHELITRRMGVSYEITTSQSTFLAYTGPKINYSHQLLESAVSIVPHDILFEDQITNHHVPVQHNHEWDTLIWEQPGIVPFELFAASFYLLSRYEEYLPHKVDEHGRFDPDQSLALHYGFLETPLVDKWALNLLSTLEKEYGPIAAKLPKFEMISTFDLDTAFLYKGLENYRQFRKTVKSFTLMNVKKLAEQFNVLHKEARDPYDTYQYIHQTTNGHKVIYFILSGGDSEYDEGIPFETNEMQDLVRSLVRHYELGLHPSYLTSQQPELLTIEKQTLEAITQKKATKSRQHFLRFQLPHTMNNLIAEGFTEDYSMMYSDQVGFRASTAHPFFFFDLVNNTTTALTLFPPTIMDVTLRFGMNLTIPAALQKIDQLLAEVKQVNGLFISIWHNNNMSHVNEWASWNEVFEKVHHQS